MRHSIVFGLAALSVACAGAEPAPAKLPPPPPLASAAPIIVSAQGPERDKLPAPDAAPAWSPSKPTVFSLSNGIRVYYVEQGPTPLVSLLLLLPRGSAADPKGKAGLTSLTADMLDEGAGKRSALEISEELQRLGTDYGASTDVDSVTLAMNTIAESFEASAGVLSDIVRRPKLDKKEFDRRKEQRIADALSAESEPTSARSIVMRELLFGAGYGGSISDGTRATLKKIGYADVVAQYKALFAPDGAALVVVGGIGQEPARAALEKAFGDWKGKATAKMAPVEVAKPDKAVALIDFPGSTQSAIALARRSPGELAADYFPAMVMSRVFGGAFTSRLNLNLREDKGYTYGAGSSFHRWKDTGYFGLAANVKRETTRASIDESVKELQAICGPRPITSKERDEAVGGLLLGFPGRFERGENVAAQLASLPLYSRPDDWLEKWPDQVKAVSTDQANAAGKSYCNPDDFIVVVAGDRKVVEPTLSGLGGKLLFFDAQGAQLDK
jgi:zinc protease